MADTKQRRLEDAQALKDAQDRYRESKNQSEPSAALEAALALLEAAANYLKMTFRITTTDPDKVKDAADKFSTTEGKAKATGGNEDALNDPEIRRLLELPPLPVNGTSGNGGGGGFFDPNEVKAPNDAAKRQTPQKDPLTIDLDSDGLETTNVASTNPILFDHDGDGIKSGTGWISSDDALLVLDRNGNGSIDSGRELFGDSTIKSNGQTAIDGFDALTDLDSNSDGRISALDTQFNHLRLWRDLNQDGISQSDELFTLTSQSIVSVNVTKIANSQTLANGNQIADLGTFTKTDGSMGTTGEVTGNLADINLVEDTFHREFTNTLDTSSVAHLPDMQGSGVVRDLREAATQSAILQSLLTQFSEATTRTAQMALIDQVLDAWADTGGFAESMDARVAGSNYTIHLNSGETITVPYRVIYSGFGNVSRSYESSGTTTQSSDGSGGGVISSDSFSGPDVDNPNLTTAYRQTIAEWTQKLHIIETFNGSYFFGLPQSSQTAGALTGMTAYNSATIPEANSGATITAVPIRINFQQAQLDLLQQSYDAIKSSVYDALYMQTRLRPILDMVNLVIDSSGINVDFSQVEAHFQNAINQNAVLGVSDLIDFNRATRTMIANSDWSGYTRLEASLRSLSASEIQEIYSDLNVSSYVQAGYSNTKGIKSDVVVAGNDNDSIQSNAGDDVVFAGGGDDYVSVGTGDDVVLGSTGNDHILGDAGDDWLDGQFGDDALNGGANNDVLNGDEGDDVLNGGNGADWLYGGNGSDTLNGDEGNDLLDGGSSSDSIYGGSGNDTIYGGDGADTIVGESGDDVIYAGAGNDLIVAETYGGVAPGNDIIYGQEGDDVIYVDAGNTTIDGGLGNDMIYMFSQTSGQNIIKFDLGSGRDVIVSSHTSLGGDVIEFGAGISVGNIAVMKGVYPDYNLEIYVNNTTDKLTIKNYFASNTANTPYNRVQFKFSNGAVWNFADVQTRIAAGVDDFRFEGTGQADYFVGGFGHDTLIGNQGNDALNGGSGNDLIQGSDGNDFIEGGSGNDALYGGLGDDTLYGDDDESQDGSDTYYFGKGLGSDTIYNQYSSSVGVDILQFLEDVTSSEVSASRSPGSNDLILSIAGTTDKVTISSYFETSYMIDQIRFFNGEVWDLNTIQAKLLIPTSGDDYIIGTDLDDTISGLAGNDILWGELGNDSITGDSGNDTLLGGDGDDILDGGGGDDLMFGDTGNDTYIVDNIADIVTETATAASEIDTVQSSVSYTLGANLEKLTLTGTSAINGTGNTLANTIIGNSAANLLKGEAGNDTLDGGAGIDTLEGGTGNDTYIVDHSSDVITEVASAGTDTVLSSASYTLSANLENITLTGSANINATGNTANNKLVGNSADNILDGGAGTDTMEGGAGNDTYVVDASTDIVTEAASAGTDAVQSTISYTLGNNIENLVLTGATAINGTGNTLANTLTGNSAANVLNGGSGADIMIGGLGNDTYVVDNVGDVVTETSTLATEVDTVQSAVSYTLGSNLENLTLTGTAAINATGNLLANTLTGNSGNNTLDGGTGIDTMVGGTGNDTYIVDNIADIVTEASTLASEIDTVQSSVSYTLGSNLEKLTLTGAIAINATGNTLNNTLTGNTAANLLNGGTGADTMVGGLGNDTYVVDNSGDVVTETSTLLTEVDAVQSSVTFTLSANVENLTLTGTTAINGTGNSLANLLIGNSATNTLSGGDGHDTLNGLAGNDTMVGGLGNDTYTIDATGDVVTEAANAGIDTVNVAIATASGTYTLATNIENAFLTNTVAYNLTGNALANYMLGNAANNTFTDTAGGNDILQGLSGIDTFNDTLGNNLFDGGIGNDIITAGSGRDILIGGLGNDTMTTGTGYDVISFNKGDGQDTINASTGADNTLSLGGNFAYSDLSLTKSTNNLVIKMGATDQITLKDWYASGTNKSVINLQVIAEAVQGFSLGSADVLRNHKVENFNFANLVAAFDAAGATANWQLTDARLTAHLQTGSDSAAIGGDLAYQYGKNSNLTGMGSLNAQSVIAATSFGQTAQTLNNPSVWQAELVKLG